MRLFAGTEYDQPPRCDRCQELEEECQCPPTVREPEPCENQTAHVQIEKRKKGKIVTVIRGLNTGTPEPHLGNLLTKLKNACGAGGSIQLESIEIQGNHAEKIIQILRDSQYQVRG